MLQVVEPCLNSLEICLKRKSRHRWKSVGLGSPGRLFLLVKKTQILIMGECPSYELDLEEGITDVWDGYNEKNTFWSGGFLLPIKRDNGLEYMIGVAIIFPLILTMANELLENKFGMQPKIRRKTSITKLIDLEDDEEIIDGRKLILRLTRQLDQTGRFRLQARGSVQFVKSTYLFLGLIYATTLCIRIPKAAYAFWWCFVPETNYYIEFRCLSTAIAAFYLWELAADRYGKLNWSLIAHHTVSAGFGAAIALGYYNPMCVWYAYVGVFCTFPVIVALAIRATFANKFPKFIRNMFDFIKYYYLVILFFTFGGSLTLMIRGLLIGAISPIQFGTTLPLMLVWVYDDILLFKALSEMSRQLYEHADIGKKVASPRFGSATADSKTKSNTTQTTTQDSDKKEDHERDHFDKNSQMEESGAHLAVAGAGSNDNSKLDHLPLMSAIGSEGSQRSHLSRTIQSHGSDTNQKHQEQLELAEQIFARAMRVYEFLSEDEASFSGSDTYDTEQRKKARFIGSSADESSGSSGNSHSGTTDSWSGGSASDDSDGDDGDDGAGDEDSDDDGNVDDSTFVGGNEAALLSGANINDYDASVGMSDNFSEYYDRSRMGSIGTTATFEPSKNSNATRITHRKSNNNNKNGGGMTAPALSPSAHIQGQAQLSGHGNYSRQAHVHHSAHTTPHTLNSGAATGGPTTQNRTLPRPNTVTQTATGPASDDVDFRGEFYEEQDDTGAGLRLPSTVLKANIKQLSYQTSQTQSLAPAPGKLQHPQQSFQSQTQTSNISTGALTSSGQIISAASPAPSARTNGTINTSMIAVAGVVGAASNGDNADNADNTNNIHLGMHPALQHAVAHADVSAGTEATEATDSIMPTPQSLNNTPVSETRYSQTLVQNSGFTQVAPYQMTPTDGTIVENPLSRLYSPFAMVTTSPAAGTTAATAGSVRSRDGKSSPPETPGTAGTVLRHKRVSGGASGAALGGIVPSTPSLNSRIRSGSQQSQSTVLSNRSNITNMTNMTVIDTTKTNVIFASPSVVKHMERSFFAESGMVGQKISKATSLHPPSRTGTPMSSGGGGASDIFGRGSSLPVPPNKNSNIKQIGHYRVAQGSGVVFVPVVKRKHKHRRNKKSRKRKRHSKQRRHHHNKHRSRSTNKSKSRDKTRNRSRNKSKSKNKRRDRDKRKHRKGQKSKDSKYKSRSNKSKRERKNKKDKNQEKNQDKEKEERDYKKNTKDKADKTDKKGNGGDKNNQPKHVSFLMELTQLRSKSKSKSKSFQKPGYRHRTRSSSQQDETDSENPNSPIKNRWEKRRSSLSDVGRKIVSKLGLDHSNDIAPNLQKRLVSVERMSSLAEDQEDDDEHMKKDVKLIAIDGNESNDDHANISTPNTSNTTSQGKTNSDKMNIKMNTRNGTMTGTSNDGFQYITEHKTDDSIELQAAHDSFFRDHGTSILSGNSMLSSGTLDVPNINSSAHGSSNVQGINGMTRDISTDTTTLQHIWNKDNHNGSHTTTSTSNGKRIINASTNTTVQTGNSGHSSNNLLQPKAIDNQPSNASVNTEVAMRDFHIVDHSADYLKPANHEDLAIMGGNGSDFSLPTKQINDHVMSDTLFSNKMKHRISLHESQDENENENENGNNDDKNNNENEKIKAIPSKVNNETNENDIKNDNDDEKEIVYKNENDDNNNNATVTQLKDGVSSVKPKQQRKDTDKSDTIVKSSTFTENVTRVDTDTMPEAKPVVHHKSSKSQEIPGSPKRPIGKIAVIINLAPHKRLASLQSKQSKQSKQTQNGKGKEREVKTEKLHDRQKKKKQKKGRQSKTAKAAKPAKLQKKHSLTKPSPHSRWAKTQERAEERKRKKKNRRARRGEKEQKDKDKDDKIKNKKKPKSQKKKNKGKNKNKKGKNQNKKKKDKKVRKERKERKKSSRNVAIRRHHSRDFQTINRTRDYAIQKRRESVHKASLSTGTGDIFLPMKQRVITTPGQFIGTLPVFWSFGDGTTLTPVTSNGVGSNGPGLNNNISNSSASNKIQVKLGQATSNQIVRMQPQFQIMQTIVSENDEEDETGSRYQSKQSDLVPNDRMSTSGYGKYMELQTNSTVGGSESGYIGLASNTNTNTNTASIAGANYVSRFTHGTNSVVDESNDNDLSASEFKQTTMQQARSHDVKSANGNTNANANPNVQHTATMSVERYDKKHIQGVSGHSGDFDDSSVEPVPGSLPLAPIPSKTEANDDEIQAQFATTSNKSSRQTHSHKLLPKAPKEPPLLNIKSRTEPTEEIETVQINTDREQQLINESMGIYHLISPMGSDMMPFMPVQSQPNPAVYNELNDQMNMNNNYNNNNGNKGAVVQRAVSSKLTKHHSAGRGDIIVTATGNINSNRNNNNSRHRRPKSARPNDFERMKQQRARMKRRNEEKHKRNRSQRHRPATERAQTERAHATVKATNLYDDTEILRSEMGSPHSTQSYNPEDTDRHRYNKNRRKQGKNRRRHRSRSRNHHHGHKGQKQHRARGRSRDKTHGQKKYTYDKKYGNGGKSKYDPYSDGDDNDDYKEDDIDSGGTDNYNENKNDNDSKLPLRKRILNSLFTADGRLENYKDVPMCK